MKQTYGHKRAIGWLFVVLVVLLWAPQADAAASLRIAYLENNPYYSYTNEEGQTDGLLIDIMNAIGNELGVKKLEYYPKDNMDECLKALSGGEVDLILGFPVFYDGDTSGIMISSEIITVDLCMMAQNEIVEQIQSGEKKDLIAVFEHNINNYLIVTNMGARLYYVVGDQQEALEKVLDGTADVMFCDEGCMSFLLEEKGLDGKFSVARNNVATVGYSIAVSSNDISLLRELNNGIYKIRMSGEYGSILKHWGNEDLREELQKIVRIVLISVITLGIILVIYFYFSWRMRKLLKRKVTEMTAELEHNIQQLQYEGELRNQIIEQAPNIMILCDVSGRVIIMNAAARMLTELTSVDGTNLDVRAVPVIGEIISEALTCSGLTRIDCFDGILVTYRHASGKKSKYRCGITAARISELETGFLIIISDETKEETKRQALIEEEKSAALSRLVAGIAHEVKNPLTGIQNFADLIKTEKDNPQFWDYFAEYVPLEIGRISRLIESLMNYARPAKGIRTRTDAAQLVDECLYLLNTAVASAKIQLEHDVPRGMLIYVERDQIKQVLINILLNSLEAMDKDRSDSGNPQRQYRLSIQGWKEDGWVYLQISDDGIGMSEETLASCMDPFFTTKEKGTGLGLSISRQFVQENGGTMDVDSTTGSGTTITLRFKEAKHEQTDLDY